MQNNTGVSKHCLCLLLFQIPISIASEAVLEWQQPICLSFIPFLPIESGLLLLLLLIIILMYNYISCIRLLLEVMRFHPPPLFTFPLLPTLFSICLLSPCSLCSFSSSSSLHFWHQWLWGAQEMRQPPAWAVESCPGAAGSTSERQTHGGTDGLNTEPWIQSASEWGAVGQAKRSLLSATGPAHCGLKGVLRSSVCIIAVWGREPGQPGCHRPFAFLSWFWKTACPWIKRLQTLFRRWVCFQGRLPFPAGLSSSTAFDSYFIVSWMSSTIKVNKKRPLKKMHT